MKYPESDQQKIFPVHLGLKRKDIYFKDKSIKNILVKAIRKIKEEKAKKVKSRTLLFCTVFLNILVEKKKRTINQILLNI